MTADGVAAAVEDYLQQLGAAEGEVRGPRRRPITGQSDARSRLGERLFETLLPQAVWQEVLDAPRVYLVPHGMLHRVPFEALVVRSDDEEGPRYVLDEAPPFVYVQSGSALLWCHTRRDEQRRQPSPRRVVALGDPIYRQVGSVEPAWPDKGLLVVRVGDGGTGAAAGLAVGDVLVTYDGWAIADRQSLETIVQVVSDAQEVGERPEVPLQVVVWRRGDRVVLHVPVGPLGIELATAPPAEAARALGAGELPDVVHRGPAATMYSRLAPLPGTAREVEAIAAAFAKATSHGQQLSPVKLLGANATEGRLFAAAQQARYLHLGTHGLVDEREQASYSALALTMPPFAAPGDDGFLTLLDLFERWRDRLSGCELAVLSACRTHRGPLHRDEGVFALSWGLHYAGCPTVVASLWSVADDSTAELMADLYARLAREPSADKLALFTAARKKLRNVHPEPFHWAPFIYIGDPR